MKRMTMLAAVSLMVLAGQAQAAVTFTPLVVAGGGGGAEAQVKVQTVSSNIISTTSNDSFNEENFTFQGFDVNLGTLNSVRLTYLLGYNGSASVTYDTRETMNRSYTASIAARGVLGDPGDASYIVNNFSQSKIGGTCGWNCVFNPGASPMATLSVSGSGTSSRFTLLTDASALAYFVSTDPIVFSNILSATAQNGEMTATGQLRVQYAYVAAAAPVPEPASWVMMLAGFGLMGEAMRRRQRNLRVTFA